MLARAGLDVSAGSSSWIEREVKACRGWGEEGTVKSELKVPGG